MSLEQRRIQAGAWWLSQMTLFLHKFASTPTDSNRSQLGEITRQYQEAVRSGTVEAPLIR
jgi:hypothetical protein